MGLSREAKTAFDITFQHETTFSLQTRDRPINFAMFCCQSIISAKFRRYTAYRQFCS